MFGSARTTRSLRSSTKCSGAAGLSGAVGKLFDDLAEMRVLAAEACRPCAHTPTSDELRCRRGYAGPGSGRP